MVDSPTHEPVIHPILGVPGEEAWLRELVMRHSSVLRRIAASQVGPDAADDVISETFATAWRERANFDPAVAPERAWLVGIAINRCRAMGRSQRRWQRRAERAAPATIAADFSDEADDRIDATRNGKHLIQALNALPDDQRLVLILVARGGLAPSEVAAAMLIPAATVRSHLLRARRALAAALELEDDNDA